MSKEIKACPFCGGEVEQLAYEHCKRIQCKTCGATTLWWGNDLARETWNKRSRKQNILPCPCCGGTARAYEGYEDRWVVQCKKCALTSGECKDKAEAIAAWNRRKRNE